MEPIVSVIFGRYIGENSLKSLSDTTVQVEEAIHLPCTRDTLASHSTTVPHMSSRIHARRVWRWDACVVTDTEDTGHAKEE
jgi:hypothetical protein